MCKLKHEEMLITYVIMSMKELRAFDRPSAISCNTSAKLEHECKLQLARASFQNSVNLDPLWNFLKAIFEIWNNMISLTILCK